MFIEICQIVQWFRKQLQPWVSSVGFFINTHMHRNMPIHAQAHTHHSLTHTHTHTTHRWASLVLTKRCYRVSNQYLSPFTAAYLSIFSSRTEKGRQEEENNSEKVMGSRKTWARDVKGFNFNTFFSVNVTKHFHSHVNVWIEKGQHVDPDCF